MKLLAKEATERSGLQMEMQPNEKANELTKTKNKFCDWKNFWSTILNSKISVLKYIGTKELLNEDSTSLNKLLKWVYSITIRMDKGKTRALVLKDGLIKESDHLFRWILAALVVFNNEFK